MLPFKLIYSDGYRLPLGEHVFPAEKYRLVRQRLLEAGAAAAADLLAPMPASDEAVLRVHTPEYVRKLQQGQLTSYEQLQLEVPYSPALVQAFWLMAGGTLLAAECALRDGAAINLGGGFHHAFPDHGEGFCMLHDVAIAIRQGQAAGAFRRALIVDTDVHQGNGTAAIFESRPAERVAWPSASGGPAALARLAEAEEVFTVSLHQLHNYPERKPASSLDVDLPDRVEDADYLAWLEKALANAFARFDPQLIAYVAGADPYGGDQLGGLALTIAGLKRRDEIVFQAARRRKIPVVTTFGGGYARKIEDTVTIHANTVLACAEAFG